MRSLIAEKFPDDVDLGKAALAFNSIYNQGKSGRVLSAVKNAETLSHDQRQYAYQMGIMDRTLEGAAKKSSGEVLQNRAESGTINSEGRDA